MYAEDYWIDALVAREAGDWESYRIANATFLAMVSEGTRLAIYK